MSLSTTIFIFLSTWLSIKITLLLYYYLTKVQYSEKACQQHQGKTYQKYF